MQNSGPPFFLYVIQFELSSGLGSHPGIHGYWWWESADFSHSVHTAHGAELSGSQINRFKRSIMQSKKKTTVPQT